jgi:hypothetical protein
MVVILIVNKVVQKQNNRNQGFEKSREFRIGILIVPDGGNDN